MRVVQSYGSHGAYLGRSVSYKTRFIHTCVLCVAKKYDWSRQHFISTRMRGSRSSCANSWRNTSRHVPPDPLQSPATVVSVTLAAEHLVHLHSLTAPQLHCSWSCVRRTRAMYRMLTYPPTVAYRFRTPSEFLIEFFSSMGVRVCFGEYDYTHSTYMYANSNIQKHTHAPTGANAQGINFIDDTEWEYQTGTSWDIQICWMKSPEVWEQLI